MEPHQDAPSPPLHIPSPARHHHYLNHTSSAPTLSDKRHLRRAIGSPYPQSISIPPPPTPFTSSPTTTSTRQSNISVNIPSRPSITANSASPPPSNPFSVPLASPFEAPPTPRTPTSSLARRRRSTVSNNSGTYPDPDTISMPPPPPINTGHGQFHYFQAQQQNQQNHRQQPTSAASTPGQSSHAAASFWASGTGDARANQGSSLFIRDDAGIGGSWVGWSTANRAPPRQELDDAAQRELELEMEVAMEDDSDSEDVAQEAINAQLNESAAQDKHRNDARMEAEDSLARIAQAMTLLSLAPAGQPSQFQYTSHPDQNSSDSEMPWYPHPTPESLLRESLRQNFEALRILKELDKKFVMGGVEARQKPVASPVSRRQSLRYDEEEGKSSVVDVLRAYERAAEGVKSSREVLKWAEHWIHEEGEKTRERLLKS